MGKRQEPKSSNSGIITSPFDWHPYAEASGLDPLFASAPFTKLVPTTEVRPFQGDLAVFDAASLRLAQHYLRMPYFSRESIHSLQYRLNDAFEYLEKGTDFKYLVQHDELRIVTGAGDTVSESPLTQSKRHAHYGMHYKYHSAATVLAAVQAMVFGRTEGFRFSRSMTSTLKFSTINSLMSPLIGMPIDRRYIQACVNAMKVLVSQDKQSVLVSLPVWLPLDSAYVDDYLPLTDTSDYVNYNTERHPVLGEYMKASPARLAWGKVDAYDKTNAGCTYGIDHTAPLSKGLGFYFDHFQEMVDQNVKTLVARYRDNSISAINVMRNGSEVARLWTQPIFGIVDDVLKPEDVAQWAEEVSKSKVDMTDYARVNWGVYRSFAPTLRRVASGKGASRARCGSPMALHPFTTPDANSYDLSTVQYYHKQKALNGAMWELPYVYATRPTASDVSDFLSGEAMDVNFGASADLGYGAWKTAVEKLFNNLGRKTLRWVSKSTLGKFLEASKTVPNAFADEELTRIGAYVPQYSVSPFVDPNDPLMHGVYEIAPMDEASVAFDDAWELPFAKAEASFTLGKLCQHANAAGGYATTDISTTGYSMGTDANGWPFAMKKNGVSITGPVSFFLGDALQANFLAHLCRSTIMKQRCVIDTNVAIDFALVPISPFKRQMLNLSMAFFLAPGVNDNKAMLTGVTVKSSGGGDVVIDLSAVDNTLRTIDMDDFETMFNLPINQPDDRRLVPENTHGGLYLYETTVDARHFPFPSIAGTAAAGPKNTVLQGPKEKKSFKRDNKKGNLSKDRREDKRYDPRGSKPSYDSKSKFPPTPFDSKIDPRSSKDEDAKGADLPVV